MGIGGKIYRKTTAFVANWPFNIGIKLMICLKVLFGDWRMIPWPGHIALPFYAGRDPEELKLFDGLDETSAELARKSIEFASNYSMLPGMYRYCFCDFRVLRDYEHDRKLQKIWQKELDKCAAKYGFPANCTPDAESLVFHHGLKEMPAKVRDYIAGKIFIDGGACYGDSTLVFMDYQPQQVYAFEPSAANREIFLQMMAKNRIAPERFKLLDMGLSSEAGEINFDDTGLPSASAAADGTARMRLTSLDEFLAGKSGCVGLIKADLEGMGVEMLKGAMATVRRCRPVLSLAIYHNAGEFFDIYKMLTSENLNYRICLRSLDIKYRIREINLLAYPAELAD